MGGRHHTLTASGCLLSCSQACCPKVTSRMLMHCLGIKCSDKMCEQQMTLHCMKLFSKDILPLVHWARSETTSGLGFLSHDFKHADIWLQWHIVIPFQNEAPTKWGFNLDLRLYLLSINKVLCNNSNHIFWNRCDYVTGYYVSNNYLAPFNYILIEKVF